MVKKVLCIITGCFTLALALVGIVVRGIPTTPLLLLTLMLYSKGSLRLERWFRRSFFYKKFLAKYDQQKGLTRKEKVSIQLFAGLMMALTFVLLPNIWLRISMVLCFIAMNYVFIFRIKTYRPTAG